MKHGKCCNCFVCKLGKAFGFIEECNCEPKAKKTVKKATKKSVKKVVKKKTAKRK